MRGVCLGQAPADSRLDKGRKDNFNSGQLIWKKGHLIDPAHLRVTIRRQ
jgi:hypothetical protein